MGRPLPHDLAALIGREVRVDNDANCFALSEARDDEFRRYPTVLGIILGTGVGGGLIVDGKTVHGRNYIAGEFGHLRLPVDALEVLGRDVPRVACGCGHGVALKITYRAAVSNGCTPISMAGTCLPPDHCALSGR